MVIIQNVEVVDVEEGEEHTFEDNHRIFSLRRTTFTPQFIDSPFVTFTYLTEVFDPENFSTDEQIGMIMGNLWRCRSNYVGCAVFGNDSKIYYRERFLKTFRNWLDSMFLNLPSEKKWFTGSKKRVNYVFNRLGMGFHLIHNCGIAFNSFEHDLLFTSTGFFQFMTLADSKDAPGLFRMDLKFFIKLYMTCIFHPILRLGEIVVETLMNDPKKVADKLGFDDEVLMFIDQAKIALGNQNFPEDLIFGHPMFYGVQQKMRYHETLCTEYLGDTWDQTIYRIDEEFYYWRESFKNKEVEERVWYVLRGRMERAGEKDFEKFKNDNKFKNLFKDFCMLYYNTKKHMERAVGEVKVGQTGVRLKDVEIYKLVDELLGGGTITEIHGRLINYWLNDPVRLAQLLHMLSFF